MLSWLKVLFTDSSALEPVDTTPHSTICPSCGTKCTYTGPMKWELMCGNCRCPLHPQAIPAKCTVCQTWSYMKPGDNPLFARCRHCNASMSHAFISAQVTAPGRALRVQFIALGTLTGMTRDDIVAKTGPPNSISAMPDGSLCQWMRPGYHMAIRFDANDIFAGISHESTNLD